jgi:ectoine hydroxylase-related dioxygenase (phytanoyl-CoA dioxygenase family)
MWTLDNFTKTNGATRFVVGSHRFMKFPKNGKVYSGEKIIEAPSGSAIIFNGALWHGSSKTKEEQTRRWGIICRYARWFLKPSYDFQKNTPKKIFNKMNKNQKDLLGFRFNPPKDEFTGKKTIQKKYSRPLNYTLPL